ncbi:hypothetical protein GOODEAATRI_014164 [Goodea atripinnis]|uniref:Uncharacterized protein n=1 Tax=Goodea atripinnis TaxID=208336 RepID=A0ABV0N3E4_9TELE
MEPSSCLKVFKKKHIMSSSSEIQSRLKLQAALGGPRSLVPLGYHATDEPTTQFRGSPLGDTLKKILYDLWSCGVLLWREAFKVCPKNLTFSIEAALTSYLVTMIYRIPPVVLWKCFQNYYASLDKFTTFGDCQGRSIS